MKKSTTISVRLDDETKEKLDSIIKIEKCKKSDVLNLMISNYQYGVYTNDQNKKEALRHFLKLLNLINELDDELSREIKEELEVIQCLIW